MIWRIVILKSEEKNAENFYSTTYVFSHQLSSIPVSSYSRALFQVSNQWCRYFPDRFHDCIFRHVVLGGTLSWLFLVVYIFGLF